MSRVRRIANWCFTLLVIFQIASMAACSSGPQFAIIAPNGWRRAVVRVEIANTTAARELGLMYRKHLDENAGMIFVFAHPDQLSFWMKNTEIPLDMIFADSNGKIIGIVGNAAPYSETPVSVDGNSLYVLEVNGGFAKRRGIRVGDKLDFIGFTPSASG